ncbi:hypothetical protein [Nonomuraea jabiensis]|uniref:hypothetical protein n=1 Tax=Nonomuraea jabiensis TaxID=882448 RepID=UPI003D753E5F
MSSPYEHGERERLANRIRTGFRAMPAGRGADLAYGRRLPGLLRAAGLGEVAAEACFPIASPACDLLETATVAHIRDGARLDGRVILAAHPRMRIGLKPASRHVFRHAKKPQNMCSTMPC